MLGMKRALFGAILGVAAIAFACGGPLETKAPTAGDQKTASDSPPASASPVPPESSADPLCGSGWRWGGTHCAPAGMATTASNATSGGAASSASAKSAIDQAARSGPHVTIEEIKIGTGAEAHDGNRVKVHYVGKLADGTTFDSSRDRGQPFSFTIGLGEVIHGFDDGVTGMKVGGMRKVTIPPALGYGRRGAPPKIPPDATLTFELELLGVE